MALEITESTAKKLFALSKNRCARPECNTILVLNDKTNLGEMCHIRGEKPNSARYDLTMSDIERRDISNLIVLCTNCHTIIDSDEDTYQVSKLLQMKHDHESKNGTLFEIPEKLLQEIMDKERLRVQQINQYGEGQQLVTQSGNIIHGWTSQDVISLFQLFFGDSFLDLDKSKLKMIENIESFAKTFVESGLDKIDESQKKKFTDPDLRFTLEGAIKTAARKNDRDLHKTLSALIVQRIQSDDDLEQVVTNEAIAVLGKLTNNQLKIITLCFLLSKTNHMGAPSEEKLNTILEDFFSPLLPVKVSISEIGYIESVSCGTYSGLTTWEPLGYFKSSFSDLFGSDFNEAEVDALKLDKNLQDEIFGYDHDSIYKCKVPSFAQLSHYLTNKGVEKSIKNKVLDYYKTKFDSDEHIFSQIEKNPTGAKLIELLRGDSDLRHLQLTSVGISIAINYFQIVTGIKVDSKIWIN